MRQESPGLLAVGFAGQNRISFRIPLGQNKKHPGGCRLSFFNFCAGHRGPRKTGILFSMRQESPGLLAVGFALQNRISFRIPFGPKQKAPWRVLLFWRRNGDSNPGCGCNHIHDFQSCSFDQLGHFSVHVQMLLYYTENGKKNQVFFRFFSKLFAA